MAAALRPCDKRVVYATRFCEKSPSAAFALTSEFDRVGFAVVSAASSLVVAVPRSTREFAQPITEPVFWTAKQTA